MGGEGQKDQCWARLSPHVPGGVANSTSCLVCPLPGEFAKHPSSISFPSHVAVSSPCLFAVRASLVVSV